MALVDLKSDLSWYGKPPAVNYFPDSISGEKGFTDKMTSTQYIGVENNSYTYPTTVRGGRLMQPKASVKFPGPQNFFDDKKSGATGFTLYMEPKNGSKLPSQFTVDADVLIVPRKNSKYPEFTGDGTLKNQLGLGSPFRYLKNGSFSTKAFSNAGTNSKNTYESTIVNGQSHLLVKATEQNSPSAIDEEYKKHNLRDESYNPTYMAQPFILRGIQRKGEEKPQYWGFGSKSGFDDGLIRGGAVTVADRIVADTDRIAKFMASPKGLLWVVKQIGLGLTNPKVEVNPNAPLRQTRIHTGITSMLSVPGTPLGLHVPAHGNPFTYEVANYENVQREKINLWGNSKNPLAENRLVDLKNKFFNYKTLTLPIIGLPKIVKIIINDTLLQKGQSILPLSGLGGPGSVYGIGSTTIKRVVDTGLESLQRAAYPVDRPNAGFKVKYQYSEPYINKNTKPYQVNYSGITEKLGPKIIDGQKEPTFSNYNNKTPGNDKEADISSSPIGNADIKSYITLAYGKIPKSNGLSKFNDFRTNIANSVSSYNLSQASQLGTGNAETNDYYDKNNLETKYGFGKQGEVGADRTNPYDYIVSGSEYNGIKKDERKKLIDTGKDKFRGDKITALDIGNVKTSVNGLDYSDIYPDGAKDFIKFVFSDGDYGKNAMVFRATLTGYQDSFSPGWEKIDIMGRPDGAYIYTSYERSISFSFMVAATSRPEMIPMWRKLNYLSTYTMPDLTNSRPSGPFMRITIGDLFNATPGFIESLSYSIPDDATWDIAEDASTSDQNPKQLPMIVEVSMTFKIISDYRPKLLGRAYSLSEGGAAAASTMGNWLSDSSDQTS